MSDPVIVTGVVHKHKDPRTGVKYLNNYKYVAHLGAGSYGRVKLYEASGRLYAVKVSARFPLRRRVRVCSCVFVCVVLYGSDAA